MHITPHIFRAYDIRGLATGPSTGSGQAPELTPDFARILGRAYTKFLVSSGQFSGGYSPRIVVGHDNRETGDALSSALIAGMMEEGADVTDIGFATSPYLYFATCEGQFDGGINVTGSHNPPAYNGFKMTRAGAAPIAGDEIQAIRMICEEIEKSPVPTPSGHPLLTKGERAVGDFREAYFARLRTLAPLRRPLKVVIDCGNGTACYFSPAYFHALGCEVVELYCEPDPTFPHHLPNPEEVETLHDLQKKVVETGADIGLAWDGDADRVGVVDETGAVIVPDRLMVLLARDVLSRHAGAEILFDVKCSNVLADEIVKAGGKATRWKTGHSFIKQKMRETGALLAGEVSGHIFFGEDYFGVDDGLLAAAKVVSIVSANDAPISSYFADLPETFTTPELKVTVDDRVKFDVMARIAAAFERDYACDTLDGVRFTFEGQGARGKGQEEDNLVPRPSSLVPFPAWGLIRPSNTSPYLTLRFEAGSRARLDEIVAITADRLAAYPELNLTPLRG